MKRMQMMLLGALLLVTLPLLATGGDEPSLVANPNPFDVETTITFYTPFDANINLTVTDPESNSVVRILHNGWTEKGLYVYTWDGTSDAGDTLEPGNYELELFTGSKFTSIKKIIILK